MGLSCLGVKKLLAYFVYLGQLEWPALDFVSFLLRQMFMQRSVRIYLLTCLKRDPTVVSTPYTLSPLDLVSISLRATGTPVDLVAHSVYVCSSLYPRNRFTESKSCYCTPRNL